MINQQLTDYIQKARAGGQTDEQISQALVQQGWQQPDIQAVLANSQPTVTPGQPAPRPILEQTSQEKLWFETTWAGLLFPLLFSWIGIAVLVFFYRKSKRRMPAVLRIWLIFQGLLIPLILGPILFTYISTRIQQRIPTVPVSTITPAITKTPIPTSPNQLPNLFEGYSWVTCEGMKANFLKPNGWYFKEDKINDAYACFITKEQIGWPLPTSDFETGLSINAVPNISQKTSRAVSVFAKEYIEQPNSFVSSHFGPDRNIIAFSEVTSATPSSPDNKLSLTSYRRFLTVDNPTTKAVFTVFANDATDTMYTLIFESPESKWVENEKIGEQITTVFTLDKTF